MSQEASTSFEEAFSRLEAIVEQLDGESGSLDESIALYEEGISLAKQCTQTLDEAALRIEKVNQKHAKNDEE